MLSDGLISMKFNLPIM